MIVNFIPPVPFYYSLIPQCCVESSYPPQCPQLVIHFYSCQRARLINLDGIHVAGRWRTDRHGVGDFRRNCTHKSDSVGSETTVLVRSVCVSAIGAFSYVLNCLFRIIHRHFNLSIVTFWVFSCQTLLDTPLFCQTFWFVLWFLLSPLHIQSKSFMYIQFVAGCSHRLSSRRNVKAAIIGSWYLLFNVISLDYHL